MKIILKIFIIVIFSIFLFIKPSYSEKTLYITQNINKIFNLNSNFGKNILNSKGFDTNIESEDGLELRKIDDYISIWVPLGIQNTEAKLIINYNNKKFELNIKAKIEKDIKDFNIFNNLTQISIQDKSLSCESSATADIITTLKGSIVKEDDVIDKLQKTSYYNKKPENIEGKWIWGNPNEGFVGYIDHTEDIKAKQKLLTGYGVYEQPIKNIYEQYGLNGKIADRKLLGEYFGTDKHLAYILKNLENGKMVQLWGDRCTDEKYEDGELKDKKLLNENLAKKGINAKNSCYNTFLDRTLVWYYEKDGNLKKHIGLDGEHAFILLGWKGDINNPSHIKVWDTSTGYHEYETKEWMRKWSMMDYKSIIISN